MSETRYTTAFHSATNAEELAEAYSTFGEGAITARGHMDGPGADTVVIDKTSTRLHDDELLQFAATAGFELFARDADELTLYDPETADW